MANSAALAAAGPLPSCRRSHLSHLLGGRAFLLSLVLLGLFLWPANGSAQSMSNYTFYPPFEQNSAPPNILFLLDLSGAMLPPAYGSYPLSYNTSSTYSSNHKGTGLTVTDASDAFNSATTYFGMFDPLGCYTGSSQGFGSRTAKTSVTDLCSSAQWDGNFLNWLSMRKVDLSKKVLIGGRTSSASNNDGTANLLLGEPKTGQNGSTNTCNSTSKPCHRYVKFIPSVALAGRVPTSLGADTAWSSLGSEAPGTISSTSTSVDGVGTTFTKQFQVGDSIIASGQTKTVTGITDDTHLTVSSAFTSNLAAGTAYYAPGRFFGSGEGTIYVNANSTAVPFDATSSNQFPIQVNLTAETDAYRRAQSLGLLQNLNTDNMRVAVMFTNSIDSGNCTPTKCGVAANVFRAFDADFNPSAITGIRNQAIGIYGALAESTYEALCYYRNSQGPCFSNSPADFVASVGAQGDPFFFVSANKMVSCCKSYILMISAGQPSADGNNTPNPAPFGNLITGADTVGLSTTRLDDVALYGQTHDIRNQAVGTTGFLGGTQRVTFYAVNAMGGASGAPLLASAAKFGGFEDRNGDGLPDAGGQSCTYPAGSSLGTGSSTSSIEWDANHDCEPDTYFEAVEGAVLQAQINAAITQILTQAASGTSTSVIASSTTAEGAAYQAYYLPCAKQSLTPCSQTEGPNDIKWLGFLQGLFVDAFGNLREDYSGPGCTGPPDGKLVLEHDCIVKIRLDPATNDVKIERYKDLNGDGVADTTTPFETVPIKEIHPIWEAGARLAYTDPGSSCATANAGVSCRRILSWIDTNNDKAVTAGEVIEFRVADQAALCPYLGGTNVSDCVSGGAQGAGQTEAANIIRFLRGEDGVTAIGGLRDRTVTVANPDGGTAANKVWKLGDIMYSTPVIVGAPRERYDVIYGDTFYGDFYLHYRARRQVVYVGSNGGMLHAFNAGFYTGGDNPSTTDIEHGFFNRTPPASITTTRANPQLGAELWSFIPQELLPQLKWLTKTDYTHVPYVDVKPKVTDVRIFPEDDDHPHGWGTILIVGMRYGGSCGNCTGTGTPMTVTADFNGNGNATDPGDTRTFYSAYIVLDITNPEVDPKLLWVFTDSTLGLTTSIPAVLRVSPTTDGVTDNTNAKWIAVFGSGPTAFTGTANSNQVAKFFVVDLSAGPIYDSSGNFTGTVFSTGDTSAFMGDMLTLDADLDYRVDVIFAGTTMTNSTAPPTYVGKMYRLTTASSPIFSNWGIAGGGSRVPTVLLSSFAYTSSQATTCATASPCPVGPITTQASVAIDDANALWVYFGTGRFLTNADKTNNDIQHFFGVKDCIVTHVCSDQSVEHNNLFNVSLATVCSVCSGNQVTGLGSGITTLLGSGSTSLVGTIEDPNNNIDGWFTTLPNSGERALSSPTVVGGTVFFTTFVGTDFCTSVGDGRLYALFYRSGSAYFVSSVGTTTQGGSTVVSRSMLLAPGLPSQVAIHIGAHGTGQSGSTSSVGCTGRATGVIQAGTGAVDQVCMTPALPVWSRIVGWRSL